MIRPLKDGRKDKTAPLPLSLIFFFEEMETGVDYGAAFVVRWVSKSGRYVIYTCPGHMTWAGVGMRWEYWPAEHYVADLRKSGDLVGLSLKQGTTIAEYGGRYNPKYPGRLDIEKTLKRLKIKEAAL